MLNVRGTLYGTTRYGGMACAVIKGTTQYCGTVFEVTTSGKVTVFKVSMSGAERVLYSFKGKPDGLYPFAGLTRARGKLYGTTLSGGTFNKGTVYEISTSGKERVLYSFKGTPDGSEPTGLLNVRGTLHGVTQYGGSTRCKVVGCGTVFAFTP